jgi:hypothetical protein
MTDTPAGPATPDTNGTVDHRLAAHRAAVAHLEACLAHLDQQAEVDAGYLEAELLGEDPSSAPFDGCEDCLVREVLHAAWPHLLAEARPSGSEGGGAGDLEQV